MRSVPTRSPAIDHGIADADGGNEKPAGRRVFGSSIEPRRIGAIT
jgi:hypothetical protein